MPNGESGNWIRFLRTLEGYHAIHGNWPSRISLYPFFIKELQEKLHEGDYSRLQENIQLIPDSDYPFLASDESGKTYDYSREASPRRMRGIDAMSWLGVSPPGYFD